MNEDTTLDTVDTLPTPAVVAIAILVVASTATAIGFGIRQLLKVRAHNAETNATVLIIPAAEAE